MTLCCQMQEERCRRKYWIVFPLLLLLLLCETLLSENSKNNFGKLNKNSSNTIPITNISLGFLGHECLELLVRFETESVQFWAAYPFFRRFFYNPSCSHLSGFHQEKLVIINLVFWKSCIFPFPCISEEV